MSGYVGLSPKNPSKYVGPNVYISTIVTRNREPGGADYRQPETGKLYPVGSYWIIGANPTTGTQGDLWYLSKIVANVAFWLQISSGGSGTVVDIEVDAVTSPGVNPVTPVLGEIDIFGEVVANHSVPIETHTRALGSFNIEVQYSGSSAATDSTKSGLAHYNSAQFSVDAVGFVSLSGAGTGAALKTLTGDSGGVISGDASNNIDIKSDANFTGLGGTGIIVGTANKLTLNLTQAFSSPTAIGNTTPNSGRFTGIGVGIAAPVSGISLASANGILYNTASGASGGSSITNTQTIYEVGTYTPIIFGGTIAGAGTYNSQAGSYTRIGNLAVVSVYINQQAHTGTGDLFISLPFACRNVMIFPGFGAYITQPGALTFPCLAELGAGSSSAILRDTVVNTPIQVANINQIYELCISYIL